jgi:Tfp pilus assembly protein PilF
MDYKEYKKQALEADSAGDYKEAIKLFTSAIKVFPKEDEEDYDGKEIAILYCFRGFFYEQIKQDKRALTDYIVAIKLDHNLAMAYNNLGYVYYKRKEYKNALKNYNTAIKKYPNNTNIEISKFARMYVNRGLLYKDIKDYKKALLDLKKAIKLNANFIWAFHGLALCYSELNDIELAKKNSTKMFRLLRSNSNLEQDYKQLGKDTLSIFKFSPVNENTLKTLINQKLFLSQPHKHWNDPHDCNIVSWGETTQQLFREKARLQAFMIAKEGKNIYENTLLWSHYADSHKGICIEYEYKLNRENKTAYLHKVKYQEEVQFDEVADSFKIKAIDWQYENEVRLFHFDENNEEHNNVLKSFEELGLEIKAIYFGTQCSQDNQETITRILESNQEIEFYKIKTEDNSFVLKTEPKKIGNKHIFPTIQKRTMCTD